MAEEHPSQPQTEKQPSNALASKEDASKADSATKIITAGTALAALGIVMSLTSLQDVAGFVALAGLATSIFGLHRFGRSGRSPTASQG